MGELSDREILRQLSDKAWTELCNRLFIFHDDGRGPQLRYLHYLVQPKLAAAILDFINWNRWYDNGAFEYVRPNLRQHYEQDAYQTKALKFSQAFLKLCWFFPDELHQDVHRTRFVQEPEEGLNSYVEALEFFKSIRPRVVEFMAYYNMLDVLRTATIDPASRRALRKIAMQTSWNENVLPLTGPLAEAYGARDPEYGWFVLSHRTAAEILLLYPLLELGRRRHSLLVREKKRLQETRRLEELQQELAKAEAALEEERARQRDS
jgi:hypothetical protein